MSREPCTGCGLALQTRRGKDELRMTSQDDQSDGEDLQRCRSSLGRRDGDTAWAGAQGVSAFGRGKGSRGRG